MGLVVGVVAVVAAIVVVVCVFVRRGRQLPVTDVPAPPNAADEPQLSITNKIRNTRRHNRCPHELNGSSGGSRDWSRPSQDWIDESVEKQSTSGRTEGLGRFGVFYE